MEGATGRAGEGANGTPKKLRAEARFGWEKEKLVSELVDVGGRGKDDFKNLRISLFRGY
jgi:hypothetical protein